ncbi:paraquat-inducible protein A [Gammaproteobacteria bacterium AS21]
MSNRFSKGSAAANGLAGCRTCLQLNASELTHCHYCGDKVSMRIDRSVQKTMALLLASIVFYLPANLLPIMRTSVLGNEVDSTIISGVLLFFDEKAYFVASVIFIASIVIPISKMFAILWLCRSVTSNKAIKHKELTKLYTLTEFIGKWSMVDVFVVAILVALIQVGNLMSIKPGLAAVSFSVVVILTMLSAQCFDSRLLWDRAEDK